jgi:hypothetical protein
VAKLIYIGGYGRSGSTLLEYLLTTHPSVVGCGEVERHLRRFASNKLCTCGKLAKRCPVWKAFRHKSGRIEGWDHKQLTLALLDRVSRRYAAMIDSSKTAWGSASIPFQLCRSLGPDFLLVHIVRDPRGVVWSAMKPRSRPHKGRHDSSLKAALRSMAGWVGANLACEVFGLRHPENYLRLRYEDLVPQPREGIGQILERVSLQPPSHLDPEVDRHNRHQLYGNAMRFRPLSLASIREDTAWKAEMPNGYQRLVGSLCSPLLRRYGYPVKPA